VFAPQRPLKTLPVISLLAALSLAMLSLLKFGSHSVRKFGRVAGLLLLLVTVGYLAGCSSGSSGPTTNPNGTPIGSSTLTVTSTSGSLTHTTTVTLTVQ
jgi:hypothetical protein